MPPELSGGLTLPLGDALVELWSGLSRAWLKHTGLSFRGFSIRLKLLAHSSSHEPGSNCYSASVKEKCGQASCICVLADAYEKGSRCWLEQ